jgi:hypothetical protein
MNRINYDGKVFKSLGNSETGEASEETFFQYHQSGDLVWAEYKGGEIVFGSLLAQADENGILDMRYHHLNRKGNLMTGICRSTPQILPDGRIRLFEKWQWTCGNFSEGESVIEETENEKLKTENE